MVVGGYFFIIYYNRVTELQTVAGQMARAFNPKLEEEFVADQRYEYSSGAGAVAGLIMTIVGAVQQETKSAKIQVSPNAPTPPPPPLRCKHCNAELRKEDVFCPKCGAITAS